MPTKKANKKTVLVKEKSDEFPVYSRFLSFVVLIHFVDRYIFFFRFAVVTESHMPRFTETANSNNMIPLTHRNYINTHIRTYIFSQ